VVVINNTIIRGILFVNAKGKVALFKNLFGSSTIARHSPHSRKNVYTAIPMMPAYNDIITYELKSGFLRCPVCIMI